MFNNWKPHIDKCCVYINLNIHYIGKDAPRWHCAHFILVYSKSVSGSIMFIDITLSKFVWPTHRSGWISWFAYTLVAMKLVGFFGSARKPPTVAISPSLKVEGSGPLNRTIMSFLKSVIMNLFSKVPFFTAILPCLITPESLNLCYGRVEFIKKWLGVTLISLSNFLLASKSVPSIKIRLE